MDFKDLRKDLPVYIFDRNGEMNISVAKVVSDASTSHIDYSHPTGGSMQMVVDVCIEVDGTNKTYVVPDNAATTLTPDNKVISTDINPILRELEAVRDRNLEIVKSAPECEKRAARCNELLEQYSPELRRRKDDEQRYLKLDQKISNLTDKLNSFISKFPIQ